LAMEAVNVSLIQSVSKLKIFKGAIERRREAAPAARPVCAVILRSEAGDERG